MSYSGGRVPSNSNQLVAQVKNILPQLTDDIARRLLQKVGWNVDNAFEEYYANEYNYQPPPPPKPVVNVNKINAFFDKFKNATDPNLISDQDNFVALLSALNDDVFYILLLAWKGGAKKSFQFTREEFVKGATELGVDDFANIRQKDRHFLDILNDESVFKTFYKSAINFYVTSESNKRLDHTSTKELLRTTLTGPHVKNRFKDLEEYIKFMDEWGDTQIKLDTIDMTLEFGVNVSRDLSQFDPDKAWPVFILEYVDWKTSNGKKLPKGRKKHAQPPP